MSKNPFSQTPAAIAARARRARRLAGKVNAQPGDKSPVFADDVAPARKIKAIPAEAVALYKSLQPLMVSLAGRWMDEAQYEDIEEYRARIAKELPEGAAIIRMTSAPFGFRLAFGGQVYALTCGARSYNIKHLGADTRPQAAPKADPLIAQVAAELSEATGLEVQPDVASNPAALAALVGVVTGKPNKVLARKLAKDAVAKAKGSANAPSVKPADTAVYTLGQYKGRAGAMFEFMKRVATLGGQVTREQMVDSCRVTAPHYLVTTRAQVLDYFAWAVRNKLLVAVEAPAAGTKKAPKRARRVISVGGEG